MCKKICKALGVVVILTVAILIGLPRYYGMHGRQYIENAVRAFNTNQNIQAEITQYTNHWFSSDADVAITFDNKGNKYTVINHIHAVYGPVMIIWENKKFRMNVGQAYLTFSMVMPSSNSSIKFTGPLLKGHAFINYHGDVTTNLSGFAFQSQNPHMMLNGITWTSRMQQNKQQIEATIGAFNRQDANLNVMSQPITITQDLTKSKNGIGLGDLIIRVPSIAGDINHAKFDYKNIIIKAIATEQDNNLNTTITTNIDNYQANHSTGTSSMICKLENLNAAAYLNYANSTRELLKHGAPKKEMMQIASQYLPQLFQTSTRLSVNIFDRNNVSGNTQIAINARNQNNNLLTTADIDCDKFIINNQPNMAKTNISIENLNAITLGKIIDKFSAMNNFNAAGDKRRADLEMMQTVLLLPQIIQANSRGKLVTQITSPQYGSFDLMAADVQFANTNSAPNPLAFIQSLIINIKFTAPKELVDTILLQDGPTVAKTTPILHAINIEDKEKFEQMKKYFAYWQQQGYISVDGVNYVTHISIANKETLVNGKPYQPMNPPAQQMSMNQNAATAQGAQQPNIPYPLAGQLPQTPGPQYQPVPAQSNNTASQEQPKAAPLGQNQ